jgi:hypothetical protein
MACIESYNTDACGISKVGYKAEYWIQLCHTILVLIFIEASALVHNPAERSRLSARWRHCLARLVD